MVYSHITWRSIQWNQRIKSLKWKKCVLFRFHSATLLVTQWEGLKPSWIRRESWVSLRNNKTPFYCLRINDKSNLPPPFFFLINALLLFPPPHSLQPWITRTHAIHLVPNQTFLTGQHSSVSNQVRSPVWHIHLSPTIRVCSGWMSPVKKNGWGWIVHDQCIVLEGSVIGQKRKGVWFIFIDSQKGRTDRRLIL